MPEEDSILDPDRRIIDAHMHLMVRADGPYLLDEYLRDTATGHAIAASVYIEIGSFYRPDGPEELRPLGEIEFANGMAAMAASGNPGDCRVAAAIIGHADLRRGAAVAGLLDRAAAAAPERFRGIRQLAIATSGPPRCTDLLDDPAFRTGFAELARRNLVFEAAVYHTHIPAVADLADAFPDTTIVLNHLGCVIGGGAPGAIGQGLFHEWRRALKGLAERPNVVCKISGLGMKIWGFACGETVDAASRRSPAEAWAPYVETAIEVFGADRCMMASNFPPDRATCDYRGSWNAMKRIVRSLDDSAKDALFRGNAGRIYRIDA